MKYTIMKVRLKISYLALINRKTILEMFIDQIMKTFTILVNIGKINVNIKVEEFVYDAIVRGDKDCLKKIVQ